MTESNQNEFGDLDGDLGGLDLDDESLFAELDNEVKVDDASGAEGDLDLEIGGEGLDDLDLDVGDDLDFSAGESAGGGDLELDLDVGDDLDLGGAEEAGGTDDALDLDLGGEDAGAELDLSASAGDELDDLEIGGEGLDDLEIGGEGLDDLEIGGAEEDLDLGGVDDDIEIGGEEIGELDLSEGGEDDLDSFLNGEDTGGAAESAAGDELDLGEEPGMAEDMEALELDTDALDLEEMSLDEEAPAAEAASEDEEAAMEDISLDDLSMESLEEPEEPVFDLESAEPAAEVEPEAADEAEFQAAPDLDLDAEPLDLELEEVSEELEAVNGGAAPELEPEPEEVIELEAVEEEPEAIEGAEDEFVAVEDVNLDDVDLGPPPESPELEMHGDSGEFEVGSAYASVENDGFVAVPDVDLDTGAELDVHAGEDEFVAVHDVDMDETELDLDLSDVEPEPAFGALDETMPSYAEEEPVALTEPLEMPTATPAPEPTAAAVPALSDELLMSVAHQISVELGAVGLSGKELMELSYGSVVPINRVVGEPVDLVLDGKAIGQAEIVLINGKELGVRIVALNK